MVAGGVWAADNTPTTNGSHTLALSSTAISFSKDSWGSGAPNTYRSTATAGDLTASDDNAYIWTFTQASVSNTKMQLKANGDGIVLSPTITSPNGFEIEITYTFSSTSGARASLQIGEETAQTSTSAGTLSAETTSTSAVVKITSPGSRALYITNITITPKAGSGKTTTTTTIDDTYLTNKDIYTSTSAGRLTASVTAGGSPVDGATVTWSSSATGVATIDASGNVTLVGVGTTILRASYAGNDDYNASTDTYELVVVDNDPTKKTATFEMGANKYNWESTSDGNTYYDGSGYTAREGDISISFSGKVRLWKSSGSYTMRFYSDETYGRGTMTLTADPGYMITGISISGSTLSFQNPSSGTISGGEWTGRANTVSIEKGSSTSNFTTVTVTYVQEAAEVVVSAAKYATLYYSNLAFEVPTGAEAYTVKVDGDKLVRSKTYSAGDVIAKNTAVIVKAEADDYTFTVSDEAGEGDANNLLLGLDAAGTTVGPDAGDYRFYKLSLNSGNEAGTVGFYWGATDGAAFTTGAHKAYLAVPSSVTFSSKSAILFSEIEEATTSIDTINTQKTATDAQRYNLAGQKVSESYKGIVIVNGKKYINK
jgi:hypothetical protein